MNDDRLDIFPLTFILVGMARERNPKRTKRAILIAALNEIHRNGFRATGINDILRKTGLTKGAFYHHFPTKMALGYALVEDLLTDLTYKTWLRPLEECDDPIDCLQEMMMTTRTDERDIELGCPLNNLALEMSPVDEGFRRRLNELYDYWREGIRNALKSGRDNGTVNRKVNPAETANFIVAAMAGCRSLAKNAKSRDIYFDCARGLSRYLDTLRP